MVKVILETASGRQADLFPESIPVREVLDELHADCESTAYAINGVRLDEEDLAFEDESDTPQAEE